MAPAVPRKGTSGPLAQSAFHSQIPRLAPDCVWSRPHPHLAPDWVRSCTPILVSWGSALPWYPIVVPGCH